jgi:hypothetical protein
MKPLPPDTPRPGSPRALCEEARTLLCRFHETLRPPTRCQCIAVTANTTMIATLSEHMMATGTISLRYRIATPRILVRSETNTG